MVAPGSCQAGALPTAPRFAAGGGPLPTCHPLARVGQKHCARIRPAGGESNGHRTHRPSRRGRAPGKNRSTALRLKIALAVAEIAPVGDPVFYNSTMSLPHRRYSLVLLALFLGLAVPLGIDPIDRQDWLLENALVA